MAKRVCRDCPTIYDPATPGARKGRCPTCSRRADRERGSRAQRGYGAEHQALRSSWQRRIDAGETIRCWRCGAPITGAWHLGHDDDRTITRGPECPGCNLAAAGRASRG